MNNMQLCNGNPAFVPTFVVSRYHKFCRIITTIIDQLCHFLILFVHIMCTVMKYNGINKNFTKSKFVVNTRINRTVIFRNMKVSDQELSGQSHFCPGCGWSEKKVFQCIAKTVIY